MTRPSARQLATWLRFALAAVVAVGLSTLSLAAPTTALVAASAGVHSGTGPHGDHATVGHRAPFAVVVVGKRFAAGAPGDAIATAGAPAFGAGTRPCATHASVGARSHDVGIGAARAPPVGRGS